MATANDPRELNILETRNFDIAQRRAIKSALARKAYADNALRIANPDLQGKSWLVASHRGVFAVSQYSVCTAIHGWFFGICRHGDAIYLYENCGLRDRAANLGRIVRLDYRDGRLTHPTILVKGLHGNCHQIRVIDGLLCLVDTANQAVLRFTLDGDPVDAKMPIPVAPANDTSGAYTHMNSIAKIGDRIGMILHNGKADPPKSSELIWLDTDWKLMSRQSLPGYWCHDIIEDDTGKLWHCDSKAGAIFASDGQRISLAADRMTRAIALSGDHIVVGLSLFGPREIRDDLRGALLILDRSFNHIAEIKLDGSPTDIILL